MTNALNEFNKPTLPLKEKLQKLICLYLNSGENTSAPLNGEQNKTA
jgi:hypothetical protein